MTTLRVLIWFAIAAVAMLLAVWLAERPGTVTAEWQGWRLDSSVGVLLVAVVVLIGLCIGGWLLYRWIVGAPFALLEGWGESRKKRGYRELTQGLAAVAAGDGAEAQKHARKAEQLLAEPPITLLLSAQAAQLAGDRDGANRAFTAMLEDEQTAFLGLRGLIGQALRDGDQSKALAYAERAFKLKPQTPWVVHSLFDMQAQVGQWKAAQETLETGQRRKVVDRRQGPHAESAAAGRAQPRRRTRRQRRRCAGAGARGLRARARAHRRHASASPRLQIKAGDARRAQKTLERGWALAPHPDLAMLYLEASGESDPLKRIGVMRRLASHNENDIESHLALAQASLEAGAVGRGAAASRDRRRHQPAGARLPPDGRGRGACRAPSRPRCTTGWPAPPTRRPTAPGAAPPAAPSTRPGVRCARAAAPSAPCNGARPGRSAMCCRPRRAPSWSSPTTTMKYDKK